MKWLLVMVAVFVFLPQMHATSCTVTVTPATSTLQTNQTETLTATLGTACGTNTTWQIASCSPSGNCGTLANQTRTTALYKAPTTAPSGTVNLTVTATNNNVTCSGASCAAVKIKVPTGLTVTPANPSIYLGNTQNMSSTENFSDGSTQPNVSATYTSSKTTVATVGGNTVTSVNFSTLLGSTTITANYTDPQTNSVVTGNTSLSVTTAVQINALPMPSGAPSGDQTAFQTKVLGSSYVWGINPYMIWNTVETSQGTYDFTNFDATLVGSSTSIFPSFPPTKRINIIVLGVSGGCAIGDGSGNPNCGNTATPTYVLNNLVSVDHSTPLTCTSYPGNGGSGATNGGFPKVFKPSFEGPYQTFIGKVLKHYSQACDATTPPCSLHNNANGEALAPYIGYIRFGLSAGGEVYPHCASGNYTLDGGDWTTYVGAMDTSIISSESTYYSSQQAIGANIQLMSSINQSKFPNDYILPDTEADDAVNDGLTSPPVTMGFGSQGLQKSDVANYSVPTCTTTPIYCPCTSDWCTKFVQYNGHVPLELQTTLQSDPTGVDPNSPTGSLATISINNTPVTGLIPFATSLHANILELYPYDLLYGLDPAGYCNLGGAVTSYCNANNMMAYQSAIENAVAGH